MPKYYANISTNSVRHFSLLPRHRTLWTIKVVFVYVLNFLGIISWSVSREPGNTSYYAMSMHKWTLFWIQFCKHLSYWSVFHKIIVQADTGLDDFINILVFKWYSSIKNMPPLCEDPKCLLNHNPGMAQPIVKNCFFLGQSGWMCLGVWSHQCSQERESLICDNNMRNWVVWIEVW